MKQKTLLLLFVSLFSLSLWAKTPSPASNELMLDLRITTALYQAGVENVELNQDELLAVEDEEWISSVQEAGTQILKEHQVTESDIKKVDWKKVAKKSGGFFVKIYKKFRSNSRINGVDVAIVYLLGKPFENYLIPMMLIGAGQPALAAASLFVPTSTFITGGYCLLKKFINQKKVKKMYGDEELYTFYKDLDAKIEKQLHLKKDNTYLIPARKIGNQVMLIAVNKNHNMGPHKLTFAKAYSYAVSHGITEAELKTVRKLGEKRLMRLIILVEQFYSTQSAEWLSEFEKQFSDSTVLLDNLEATKELRTWARRITDIDDCEGLRSLIHVVPAGHSSREVLRLVSDVFLPTLADSMKGWKTGMFKKMRKGLQKIEVAINIEENPLWDDQQFNRMDSMLENACR